MNTPSASTVSHAEHWLTLMTCTICDKTPDHSPVYKCSYGHILCYPCFIALAQKEIPVCKSCGCAEFTRQDVSSDFLRKLKTKPGIGRPCRYALEKQINNFTDESIEAEPSEPTLTVEELFQLPKQKLNNLFEEGTKEKLRMLSNLSATEYSTTSADNRVTTNKLGENDMANWKKEYRSLGSTGEGSQSRKPLTCPHGKCNKIVARSSFKSHFQHEHLDFKRYNIIRSSELSITFDPSVIEHDISTCIGIVSLLSSTKEKNASCASVAKEIDMFWIMTTGSAINKGNDAYVLFWIFTSNDEHDYTCTMELAAHNDMMTMTTFCRVNDVYESQCLNEVERKLNCLYVSYGTIKGMLNYGPKLKFRLTVH